MRKVKKKKKSGVWRVIDIDYNKRQKKRDNNNNNNNNNNNKKSDEIRSGQGRTLILTRVQNRKARARAWAY
jgi:hypothetical protein